MMDPNLNPTNSTLTSPDLQSSAGRTMPASVLESPRIAQLRQDRAREVALQCAAQLFSTVRMATDDSVLVSAAAFLPFLLGEDKP